jgi:hypothetical protein
MQAKALVAAVSATAFRGVAFVRLAEFDARGQFEALMAYLNQM